MSAASFGPMTYYLGPQPPFIVNIHFIVHPTVSREMGIAQVLFLGIVTEFRLHSYLCDDLITSSVLAPRKRHGRLSFSQTVLMINKIKQKFKTDILFLNIKYF